MARWCRGVAAKSRRRRAAATHQRAYVIQPPPAPAATAPPVVLGYGRTGRAHRPTEKALEKALEGAADRGPQPLGEPPAPKGPGRARAGTGPPGFAGSVPRHERQDIMNAQAPVLADDESLMDDDTNGGHVGSGMRKAIEVRREGETEWQHCESQGRAASVTGIPQPQISGFSTAARSRSTPRHRHTPRLVPALGAGRPRAFRTGWARARKQTASDSGIRRRRWRRWWRRRRGGGRGGHARRCRGRATDRDRDDHHVRWVRRGV